MTTEILLRSLLIGLLAGLHASTWGMYKDAPHEGFTLPKYLRSAVIGALLGPLVSYGLDLPPYRPAAAVLLFGATYAAERAILETWKTFFRSQDQSKYTIPMQLAVFGVPVRSRAARYGFGLAYIGAMVAGVILVARYVPLTGVSPLLLAVTVGALGGWFSAFGGAWKDAPIEGFQILKFFRSPLLAAGFALLMYTLGATPVQGLLGAIGFTVATTETYKTFFFPSKPRGKFAGKPVLFPEMLRRRTWFVPLYVAIWVTVLAFVGLALAERFRGG